MLNNNKSLGNFEVKTPSPLSSSADRSINEGEETLAESGSSSSAESSPSDLKERLRHYSSPNQATHLTNRVINVNRRLLQQRDATFHGAAERIEESEEKEQEEPSSSVIQEKGARARRRAKLRLQNQTMVVLKPTETNVLDSKSTSNDDQRSNGSSMLESRSSRSEPKSTLTETLNSPLSGRTLPILGPYRSKRNGSDNDSSRSQPPLLRLYSTASRENSPKNKVDLQSLSPISLGNVRPTRFGGYRPQASVILQNLSSGSDPESSRETVFIQRIDHLIPITSPVSPNRLPPLSSRRSSVPPEVSDPGKKIFSEINFLQDSNDRSMSTPLSSSRTAHDSFYRMGASARTMKDAFKSESSSAKAKEQPKENLSSRESCNQTSISTVNRQKLTNVPTLALNSQEMSYVTSPAAKASSGRCLDTDALIEALSNVSLKQRATNETPVNVCSEYSSENNLPTNRSRFDGSEMSYGSSVSRKSKIPVPTNRIKSNRSASQNVSSSPEGLQSYSENNDESFRAKTLSKECQVESADAAELSRFTFGESISPVSDSSMNDTQRDQNKTFESENSERMSLGLKEARSKDCLTPLEIPNDDDRPDDTEETQNETYRVDTNEDKNSCESLVEPKREDTLETQNSSDNQNEHQSSLEDQGSSARSKNHRTKYTNAYEKEVSEGAVEEKRTILLEKQIGDGCEEISQESSSEEEEFGKRRKTLHHRDKLRFSMERLAAEQLRRNIYSEQNTMTYFTEKIYEAAQHASSTSKLHHGYEKTRESPRFRKSQDRFPFTISEKTSVSSMKFKHPGRLTNMDRDKKSPGRSYHLDTHPSITRLAGSGFEDTPADIIDYVTRSEQADREVKSYGMKGLVQRFSARLRRSKKLDRVKPDTNTSVIYENHAYREEHDSLTGSCSESSLLKELRMYGGMGEPRCTTGDSPDEKSSVVSDKKSPERPYRRYDRDDLWIRTFEKTTGPGSTGQKEMVETQKELDECKSARDPYSVFFVKSARDTSVREFLPENEGGPVSVERKRDRVKFRGSSLAVVPKKSDEDVPVRNRKFENVKRDRNVGNGCLCLQFYRMIVPVSFRSVSKRRPRENWTSVEKKSRFSLQRKKG